MTKVLYLCIRLASDVNAVVAQLAERWLPKPKVAGSSPVYRSLIVLGQIIGIASLTQKKTMYNPYVMFIVCWSQL